MDARQWEHIQPIFHEASDLEPAAQRAFVESRCNGDATLVEQVMALLAGDARSTTLLDAGLASAAHGVLRGGDLAGAGGVLPNLGAFGPYRLVRLLGEGGMGVVFFAERADLGSVAAIKLLRDAWISPARRERFATEQRTLAQLSHPGIARLFDAGTLADGTPWIAMEYVDGVTLVEHCRRALCSLPDRLRIFRAICEAVQHAHRHLVIHRDIKPTNILVTADGGVKLLDFGIAKQLEAMDAEGKETETGLRLMTPAYAAPEQLLGKPVGVHTDVYALGVVLYELLAGRLPFDLSGRTRAEAEAIILHGEPDRPSKAARCQRNASGLQESPSDDTWADLDVLCLTAMHADPSQRYRTVDALVRDVDHFLNGEPLEARPDRLGYRLGKFARRNSRALATAAGVLFALVAVVASYTIRLGTARNAAVAESVRTQRIQRFMLSLFQGGDNEVGPSDSLRVITLLERGVQEASGLGAEPTAQADLYQTLGGIFEKLGRLDRADTLLRTALDRRRASFGAEHPDVAKNIVALGLLRLDQARLEEAERLTREGLAMSRRLRAADHPDIANATAALGRVLEERGTYATAIPVLEEAVRLQSAHGPVTPDVAATLTELANTHFYAGHLDASDTINRRVLAMTKRMHGDRHPLVAEELINLGAVQFEKGNYAAAERYDRDALAIIEPWYGPDHYRTASALTLIARALTHENRVDEATPLLERSLKIQEHVFGAVHPKVASALNEIGTVALQHDRYDDADRAFARMAEIYRQVYGGSHYLLGVAIANRGSVELGRKNPKRADSLFREALGVYAKSLAPDHFNVGITRLKLGRALARQRRWKEAEAEILAGYGILSKQTSPTVSWLRAARLDLITVYDSLSQPADAARYRAELADTAKAHR